MYAAGDLDPAKQTASKDLNNTTEDDRSAKNGTESQGGKKRPRPGGSDESVQKPAVRGNSNQDRCDRPGTDTTRILTLASRVPSGQDNLGASSRPARGTVSSNSMRPAASAQTQPPYAKVVSQPMQGVSTGPPAPMRQVYSTFPHNGPNYFISPVNPMMPIAMMPQMGQFPPQQTSVPSPEQYYRGVPIESLPGIYNREVEEYRRLLFTKLEQEARLHWLETKMKEQRVMNPGYSFMTMGPQQVPMEYKGRGPMQNAHFTASLQSFSNRQHVQKESSEESVRSSRGALVVQQASNPLKVETDAEGVESGGKGGKQNADIPSFIGDELQNSPGNGQFTICELMVTICFAHQLLFHRNTYSTIKRRMLNKRSRASIRRKIEKIVFKETGIDGGLLLVTEERRNGILTCLWSRFSKLIDEAIIYGSPSLESFAKRLRAYANHANVTEEKLEAGTAWLLKADDPPGSTAQPGSVTPTRTTPANINP